MAEMRTADVDNLLSVLAALDDEDTIFALLEDLFTPREIKETSQRLAVARLLAQGKPYSAIEREHGRVRHDDRSCVEMPDVRFGWLCRRARRAGGGAARGIAARVRACDCPPALASAAASALATASTSSVASVPLSRPRAHARAHRALAG